jgi:hypothetical protein
MYQVDPAATLRKIARLVRSGGRIVAIDPLHDRHYACFDPPVQANERILQLFFDLVEHRGGTPEVARDYRGVCERAGVHLVAQRGWMIRPKISPAIHCVASSWDMPCIAPNAGPMMSSGGSLNGQNSAPVAAAEGPSALGAATITSCPLPSRESTNGTIGPKWPARGVEENRTFMRATRRLDTRF